MGEQGFNYLDSPVKELADFYETRVKNLDPKAERITAYSLKRLGFKEEILEDKTREP